MSNPFSAAARAAGPPFELRLEARSLNVVGIASMAFSFAVVACVAMSAGSRTATGLLVAAGIVVAGDLLSGGKSRLGRWSASSLLTAGYLLAAFFSQASYYLPGVETLGSPFACWLAQAVMALALTLHAVRNQIPRVLAVPVTALLVANVLTHSLQWTGSVQAVGLTVSVPALASVLGLLWLAGLSAMSKHVASRLSSHFAVVYDYAAEAYFLGAGALALFVPHFCNAGQYAPLWWAVETPVLLAICWRSRNFVRHALVMGLWAVSAVLSVITHELHPLACMAVPLAGFAISMTYRYVPSTWARWQKVTGYGAYLYGAAAVSFVIPLVRMDAATALPYLLGLSGVLLGLALGLRDRLLHFVALGASAVSLVLFGARWQEWEYLMTGGVALACYTYSLLYGRILKHGGLTSDVEFSPLPGQAITSLQARWLERAAATAGYATLVAGTYLLGHAPFNSVAMAVEALALIGMGFFMDKRWHRGSGVLTIFLTSAKVWIIDLSGAASGVWAAAGFAVLGVCSITAGITYLVEWVWMNNKKSDSDEGAPPSDK